MTNLIKAKENNYIDVTGEWIKDANPNSHKVKDLNYFETEEGLKYYVDGKNVVLDYSKNEKHIAEWLEKTLGGKIYLLPRIIYPQNIKTADYLFKGECWDLKEIFGNTKNTLDRTIKYNKRQARNFIFDITNSNMSENEAIIYIENIYKSKYRNWVDKIILKNKDKLIIILKRKNEANLKPNDSRFPHF